MPGTLVRLPIAGVNTTRYTVRIMRLQAAAGRPEAVRRTLALLESRLTELGITPGAQTRQAAAALLGAARPGPGQRSPSPGPQPNAGPHERRSG
jgi:hypothetical protein